MFNFTNYDEQSRGLPFENGFQILLLQWTDRAVLLREAGKMGAVIGLVTSASSFIFNFNPTTALTCTAVCSAAWLLARTCTNKFEPQAQAMIKSLKEKPVEMEFYKLNPHRARTLGLIP